MMLNEPQKIPIGNLDQPVVLRTATDIGQVVRAQRQSQGLRQTDLAGIGNTGNRLIVDIEKGKPTVQLQKVLDVLELLGLEVTVRSKASRSAL
jgi:HTH-type transcriptional regulator / antitoxin HipB